MKTSKVVTCWSLLLAIVLTWPNGHSSAAAEKADIKEFGKNEGSLLSSGFVFYDGSFLELPYKVSRRGLAVCINDIMVAKPVKWPPEDTHVTEDPGLPEGMSEDMTFDDFVEKCFTNYNRKWRYLYQRFPPEVAVQRIREYFESLPFVQEARSEDKVTIRVITRHGEERLIDVSPPSSSPLGDPPTKENAIREVESRRKYYERRLKQGFCLFLFSSGGELSFSDRKAVETLPEVVDVLNSSESKNEKLAQLQSLKILPPQYPEAWESIVTNFQASAQLDRRMEDLRKQRETEAYKTKLSPEEEQAVKKKTILDISKEK